MTLNLTLLTPGYILQVSDRRITKEPSGQTYPLANKNVVFLARDGLVSICYSGPAYLEHVPTDTWIACKSAGRDINPYVGGESPGVFMSSVPKRPWPDIGQLAELLRQECEALFSRSSSNHGALQIVVAGWQRYNRGMRPLCWGIDNDADRRTFTAVNGLPRFWHYRKGYFYVTQVPDDPGWLSAVEMQRLVKLLRATAMSSNAALGMLIKAVRYVAANKTGVGPDCMCLFLPNPDIQPEVVVRYEPVTEGRAVVGDDKTRFELPAAFTPWFVGPQVHAPPAIIVGAGPAPFTLGDIRPFLQAPPVPPQPGGRRIHSAFSTQRRPIDPSLRPSTR